MNYELCTMHYALNHPHNPTISLETPLNKGFHGVGLNASNPTPTPLQPHSRNLFESHHLYYHIFNSKQSITILYPILRKHFVGLYVGFKWG